MAMDNEKHKPSRPNFLRRGPGLLDMFYNAWCKAAEGFCHIHAASYQPNPSPKIPAYIASEDANIICVHRSKRDVIESFRTQNNIVPNGLYIGFAQPGYMNLNRSALEELLKQANKISRNKLEDPAKRHHAFALVEAFEFLKGLTPHPKIDPVWERHNR